MVGARGPLGAAVLEQLLGASGFGMVEVAAVRPLTALPRGRRPVAARQAGGRLQLKRVRTHDAVLVFDRDRRVTGRDDAIPPARPGELGPIAALAAVATAVAGSLARSDLRGTRMMPTELVWQAAQSRHPGPLIEAWLAGEALPAPTVRVARM
jgi:hypothetical protein